MSQPLDLTDTEEINSQSSFEELWQSLGRICSNVILPEGMVFEEKLPVVVQIRDQPDDKLEVVFEQRVFKSYGKLNSSTSSQQLSDFPQPLPQILRDAEGDSRIISGLRYEPMKLPLILPNTSWPGFFNFGIQFEQNINPVKKAAPIVFIEQSKKLFVKIQALCPVIFKIKGTPPPGSGIRGILVYKEPDHYKAIVRRCLVHKDDEHHQDHVMICDNPSTIYETCPETDRLSLFVPLRLSDQTPEDGEFNIKELFQFVCFNSCAGGMNRRPTHLLFRLECGGKSVGRAVVEVRICSSPGRDCETKLDKNSPLPTSSAEPEASRTQRPTVIMNCPSLETKKRQRDGFCVFKTTKTKRNKEEEEEFTFKVVGRERYNLIKKISEGIHLLDGIQPPSDEPETRYCNNGVDSSQGFRKNQPKMQPLEIRREKPDSSQCNRGHFSSQSSQENASFQQMYTASKFVLNRTISLKNEDMC